MAFEHHPDKGGDSATFTLLHEAYKKCLTDADKAPCPDCKGTGKRTITSGITSMKMKCKTCDGSGKLHVYKLT